MAKAILFDLDGTLLPMDMGEFTAGYFGDLADALGDRVTDRKRFVKAIWAGTKAMMANDGSAGNEEVFWRTFGAASGIEESLIRLAKEIGLNESYLSTLFKKETGLGVAEYITRQRMGAAENMLKYSDFTLAEISDILNYSSYSHFARVFRKHHGTSPHLFRDQNYRRNALMQG